MPSGARLPEEDKPIDIEPKPFRLPRWTRRDRHVKGSGRQLPLSVIGKRGATYNGGKRWYKNVGR